MRAAVSRTKRGISNSKRAILAITEIGLEALLGVYETIEVVGARKFLALRFEAIDEGGVLNICHACQRFLHE